MAVHWFGWLFFSLAIALFLFGLFIMNPGDRNSDNTFVGVLTCFAAGLLLIVGLFGSNHADDQNTGLASRNTQYFKAQGFRVLSAYGHKVCVAAGPYPLCLQERKDATGKKQLVMQKANGQLFVVHGPEGGFMDALAHAPSD